MPASHPDHPTAILGLGFTAKPSATAVFRFLRPKRRIGCLRVLRILNTRGIPPRIANCHRARCSLCRCRKKRAPFSPRAKRVGRRAGG
jgi:hypothetical protein